MEKILHTEKIENQKERLVKKAIELLSINILNINSKIFSDSSNNNNSTNKISEIHQYNKRYLKIKIKLLM